MARALTLDGLLQNAAFAGLPIAEKLGELLPGRSVVQAPPGTGKTTVVPPAIAARVPGRVIVTQPRRIAARAAARRLSELTSTKPGEYAAHTVRGDSTLTKSTKVEFVTTGVLLRRLIRDPELAGVDAVILDEVHERHLDDDLALAMVSELAELRDDLTVVAMSATLDAERWAALLGGARIVAVPSVLHPLEIQWAPSPAPAVGQRGVNDAFLEHVAASVHQAVASREEGSVLVFVPGVKEVDGVVARLTGLDLPVLPLHGRLDARAQDDALRDVGRRIIVATAVAESSLTVPGVRIVVDSGLSREPRFDQLRGVSGLVTVRESKASATQRAGRAARFGPGLAVRCLAEQDWAGMAEEATPEVLVADLSDSLLTLASWGSPRGEGMNLPTPLPQASVGRAERRLRSLGLVDDDGLITDTGRGVAKLPLEPRLGVALQRGASEFGTQAAVEIVAMLADGPSGELGTQLRQLKRDKPRRWVSEAERLARLIGERGLEAARGADVGFIVASAKPEWIARRRSEREFLTASGTGVQVSRDETISSEWIAIWDLQRVGANTLIRAHAALDEATALLLGEVTTRREATFTDKVRVREIRALGAIELGTTSVQADPQAGEQAVREAVLERGLGLFEWRQSAIELRRRLALLHRELGAPWPAMDDESLVLRLDEWLGPELGDLARGGSTRSVDLTSALRRLLPWPEASRFDELAPERLQVPSGSNIRLQYPDGDGPVICAVKLQECFGLTETPRICDGRVKVLMHLLSPAQRPLAVTDDVSSFWANAYPQVRAENRGRYSKHPWPEDPLTAVATQHTKRRMQS